MSATLANITANCGANTATGWKPLLYIEHMGNVDAIPAAVNLVVSTDITFTATNGFHNWVLSRVLSKTTWESVRTGDEDSAIYRTTFTTFIPGITAAKMDSIYSTAGCGHVVLCTDKEGNIRLLGAKDDGASITTTEQVNDGTNGVQITITWDSAAPPAFYEGVITAAA